MGRVWRATCGTGWGCSLCEGEGAQNWALMSVLIVGLLVVLVAVVLRAVSQQTHYQGAASTRHKSSIVVSTVKSASCARVWVCCWCVVRWA